MRKSIVWCFICFVALMFSGCGMLGDDGRMDAWKEVQKDKEKTKQELLKTKQAEFNAGQGQTEQKKRNPTLKVTTKDSADKDVVIEMDMAPSIAAATGHSPDGDKGDTYGIKVEDTPLPIGAVAEGLKATGDAVTKVANAPAVIVGATGAAVVGALKETGGGQKIEVGGDFNPKDSFNKQEQIAIGQDLTPAQQGAKDPVIVEPSYPPETTTAGTTTP